MSDFRATPPVRHRTPLAPPWQAELGCPSGPRRRRSTRRARWATFSEATDLRTVCAPAAEVDRTSIALLLGRSRGTWRSTLSRSQAIRACRARHEMFAIWQLADLSGPAHRPLLRPSFGPAPAETSTKGRSATPGVRKRRVARHSRRVSALPGSRCLRQRRDPGGQRRGRRPSLPPGRRTEGWMRRLCGRRRLTAWAGCPSTSRRATLRVRVQKLPLVCHPAVRPLRRWSTRAAGSEGSLRRA